MKVIPAIDLMGGQVVRLYKGDPKQKTVYSNDPIEENEIGQIAIYRPLNATHHKKINLHQTHTLPLKLIQNVEFVLWMICKENG